MSNQSPTTESRRGDIAAWLFDLDVRRVLLYGVLVSLVAFFLVPIETGLVTSLKTNSAVSRTVPFLPPGPNGFTTKYWSIAFSALGRGLVNSFLFAVPATLLSALFGSLAAYGLTQINWKGQAGILALFIAGIFIPYQAVLVPLSEFWNYIPIAEMFGPLWSLPFLTSEHAALVKLIVTHVAYGIPICTLLFRGYYQGMSTEMIESARLDGASFGRIYLRIVLPLSTPMFAVTLIYQFTQIWNDLLFALILVSSSSSSAAPVVLILSGLGESLSGTVFPLRMAGALIAAIPTLLVYIAFGEEFAKGVAT